MADFKETGIEYINTESHATFFSSEIKWINKIASLKEKHPNDVEITYAPEDNGGVVVAHIPKSWMKISPPAKRTMTDEQRAAAAERLRSAREKSH